MIIGRVNILRILVIIITTLVTMNTASATLNAIIISDPTGQDPNGAASGSMSFDTDMFQSTFIFSPTDKFAVLSGGSDVTTNGSENDTPRLNMVINAIDSLKSNNTPQSTASIANGYSGQRLVVGGPTIGAAIDGTTGNWLVEVANDGTITVTPLSGEGVLPPGTKGAVIHLLHTPGNPQADNTYAVGQATAEMVGIEIRDGHSATDIMGDVFKKVSIESGEKYGGGAVNLVSGISTEDMFTPAAINQTGFPMDQPFYKIDNISGWTVGYPEAEGYTTSPINNNPLQEVYAYDALRNSITVTPSNATVFTYGSDDIGITATTTSIVQDSVSKDGLNANDIADEINRAINSGLIIGVNHVEPSNINIIPSTKQVGVYYTPLADNRTAPSWNLPISSSLLDTIGNLQTAVGLILVVLVLFRSTLISSFGRRRRKL